MAESKASYTSDTGATISSFAYRDVSKSKEKLSTTYEFANTNQTYVQTLGSTMLRLPMEMIFIGDNYIADAEAAFNVLDSSDYGTLQHPAYGKIDVAIVGEIKKEDRILTGIGSSTITVTFYQTIKTAYPATSLDARGNILEKITEANEAAANKASQAINIKDPVDEATWQKDILNSVKSFRKTVDDLLNTESIQDLTDEIQDTVNLTQAISSEITAIQRSIESNINGIAGGAVDVVGNLLTIGKQIQIFTQLPARLEISIVDRANAFIDGLSNLLGLDSKKDLVNNTNKNKFANADLQATATIAGLAEATITNTEFTTQTQAIEYVDVLLEQTEQYIVWRESQYTSLELVDDDFSTYQQIQELVNLTAGYLLELSFTLQQQKTFVCDKNYALPVIANKLYGSINFEQRIIADNNLQGDELFFVNKGKQIIYYA
jgi:prophage DNA circulation protein